MGIKGELVELKGTFSLSDGAARVRIDNLTAEIGNPFKIVDNLIAKAQAQGATSLTIEGTVANPRLLRVLQRRFGAVTEGADEFIFIKIAD